MILSLLLRFWKPLAGAALLLALGLWLHHSWYTAGEAHIQGLWDAQQKQATADLVAANNRAKAAEDTATALNRRIVSELEPNLTMATARGNSLAHRLFLATKAGSAGSGMPEISGVRPPDGASGIASGTDGLEQAVATVIGACQRDALRFSALQAEIAAQL